MDDKDILMYNMSFQLTPSLWSTPVAYAPKRLSWKDRVGGAAELCVTFPRVAFLTMEIVLVKEEDGAGFYL